jgi:hypothetical protein
MSATRLLAGEISERFLPEVVDKGAGVDERFSLDGTLIEV